MKRTLILLMFLVLVSLYSFDYTYSRSDLRSVEMTADSTFFLYEVSYYLDEELVVIQIERQAFHGEIEYSHTDTIARSKFIKLVK